MHILLHSSKTMVKSPVKSLKLTRPTFIEEATALNQHLRKVEKEIIETKMKISSKLADEVILQINQWSSTPRFQTAAADAFVGDIYSGLQFNTMSDTDRGVAQNKLRIISGLYGILRPLDGVSPYRLEMAYDLAPKPFSNLYTFWGDKLAKQLDKNQETINLTSIEYGKSIIPFLNKNNIISPIFLTKNPKNGQYVNVAVHSKIARGAIASWLIRNNIENSKDVIEFNGLGYSYNEHKSTRNIPVFTTEAFGGIGLSIRQKKNSIN